MKQNLKLLTILVTVSLCFTLNVYASGKKEVETTTTASSSDTTTTTDNRMTPPDGMPPNGTPPDGFPPDGFGGPHPDGLPPDGEPPVAMDGRGPGGLTMDAPVNTAKDNKSTRDIIGDNDDDITAYDFSSSVSINLTSGKIVYGGKASEENITIKTSDTEYSVESSLSEPVKIILKGKMDKTFTVKSTSSVYEVSLDGVEISATDGPALNLLSKKKVFITSTSGSKNILTDSAKRENNTKKGALYSKSEIVLSKASGVSSNSKTGTITVNAGYKNGIYSDDYVKLNDGNITVNVSARDGIRCISGFIMNDGDLVINGTGNATDEESKGIKVDGIENTEYAGEGCIVVNDGNLTINTVGKGMTAAWETDEDAETETTSDDPNPTLTINGGKISITTSGTPYERTQSDGTVVSCSPEGIEAKSDLVINGGDIKIRTADDAINAGISITLNGGKIDVVSTANDAIDSNGTLTINGGTIYASGGVGAECAFDSDMFDFTVNGGTIIGGGGTNLSTPAKESKQCVVIWYENIEKGELITVKDENGKNLFEYTMTGNAEAVVLSLKDLSVGKTYTFETKSGASETVEITSTTTTIGTASSRFGGGMRPEGGAAGGGMRPDGKR